jgi:gliding motility-associated lipoprotein GldH
MVRILVLVALLAAASCSKPVLVDQEFPIPEKGWTYADSLEWNFEVTDTNTIYNLLLTIDHQMAYGAQNCYVRIHTIFPAGERLSQVVSLDLQNTTGRWLGKCSGDNCSVTIPIQENAFFNQKGKHAIRLEQYMRRDSLIGLNSFRLKIEDTGERRGKT